RYDSARSALRRVLLSPPRHQADTAFRQRVLGELAESEELGRAAELAYVELRALRLVLCAQDRVVTASQAVRRRVDILLALKKAVASLLPFQKARSGLARLGAFASTLVESPSYQRLDQLLSFEDHRAVLESHLSLGYDGTLRRFDIVRVSEVEHAGFARGPGSRFLRRLFGFFRGHRFSEDDVMSQLLEQVFVSLEGDVVELLRVTLQLEFYLACLGFQRQARAGGLEVCLPVFEPEIRELEGLFNPWLLNQAGGPVPCRLGPFEARRTVIVTGPNSGGKTRFLQAVAISQLLGQVGSFVPAVRARLVWVDQLFLSLIERPAAEQKEGRLGTELLRIRKVFETSGADSLITMDELCSGTNPSEGEEIFQMVLELLGELRPQVFISTHFLDFAARLAQRGDANLLFLQVELTERERPTYQFVPGVATTSLAQTTAARLGVTRDELLGLIEARRARLQQ
ncbi:MAG TPA: DNA mismatch repair protein, partial [Polyangiaceae bacterium]|nr:DNA mismatch repair protein [Polyangiaceae bacterium]